MKTITFLLLTLLTITAYGQTDNEKARSMAMTAIKEMDSGNTKEALKLLKEAGKLDPDNLNYPYETAFAYTLDKDYKEAIKILKELTKHKDCNDRVWQMLGNCHDLDGSPQEAIEAYDKGLELFPNSGALYLERGNMELQNEKYGDALDYYEKGIYADPEFPSNYYWAAKIYMSSSEKIWGLLYGEIFMNIERNSGRTAEISKRMYDTYAGAFTWTSDSSMTISFCKQMSMSLEDISDTNNIRLPFCMIYEQTMVMSSLLVPEININILDNIRSRFVESYFKDGYGKTYPNVLFDFQKKLLDKGYLEAYNHWILMKGDEEAFNTWYDANTDKWDQFVAWFSEHPMEVNNTHRFHSSQY